MPLSNNTKKILFIDKRLLFRKRDKAIRGAEKFNLALAQDLAAMGFSLTIVACRTWGEAIRAEEPISGVHIVEMPLFRVSWVNALLAAAKLIGKRFDVLLLGNVGNGISLPTWLMHRFGIFPRCVLIAHREATKFFVSVLRRVPTSVIAVNNTIAEHFDQQSFTSVHVYYGIADSDKYFPDQTQKPKDGIVHFAVFGNLDSPWKGSDTAVEAFRLLSPEVRSRVHLHLASFVNNAPVLEDKDITVYSWLSEADCAALLRRMDVLIIPSRDTGIMKETFCQSLVQGMFTGLPVIASDLPVLTEKLDAGGGVIFRSVDELARHIETLAGDPELRERMGRLAQKTAHERYAWRTDDFVNKYLFP